MFNRHAFGRTGYNRPFTIDIFGSVTLDGVGELTAASTMIMTGQVTLDGVGTLTADSIRDLYFAATLDGIGTIEAKFQRDITFQSQMDGVGELIVKAAYSHVDTITFTGSIAPGDRIIIDAKNLTFTVNGQNALHQMQGDFFDLVLGSNKITYKDQQALRSILTRITHRDKFV